MPIFKVQKLYGEFGIWHPSGTPFLVNAEALEQVYSCLPKQDYNWEWNVCELELINITELVMRRKDGNL